MHQGQRVGVGGVQVVEGQQQRGGRRHVPDAAQRGVEPGRGRRASSAGLAHELLVGFAADVWELPQRLGHDAEGQGRLRHAASAHPDAEAVAGPLDGSVEHGGLAEPGLSDHEQRPAAAGPGGLEHPADRRQAGVTLQHRRVRCWQTRSHRKP